MYELIFLFLNSLGFRLIFDAPDRNGIKLSSIITSGSIILSYELTIFNIFRVFSEL